MKYHRALNENERIIPVDLGNDKTAHLLFTQINNLWTCIMSDEAMKDLETLHNVVEK